MSHNFLKAIFIAGMIFCSSLLISSVAKADYMGVDYEYVEGSRFDYNVTTYTDDFYTIGTSLESNKYGIGDVQSASGNYRIAVYNINKAILFVSSFNVPYGLYDVWDNETGLIVSGGSTGEQSFSVHLFLPKDKKPYKIVVTKSGTAVKTFFVCPETCQNNFMCNGDIGKCECAVAKATCEDFEGKCGTHDDNCGGKVVCGPCTGKIEAKVACNPANCTGPQGDNKVVLLNKTTALNIVKSQWFVKLKSQPDTAYALKVTCETTNVLCNYAVSNVFGAGQYTAKLAVTDKNGDTGVAYQDFTIESTNAHTPQASINCDPVSCSILKGNTIKFQNKSTDPDGQADIVNSQWCFRNITESDGACRNIVNCKDTGNVLCDYSIYGSYADKYTAKLTVTDKQGNTNSRYQDFTISNPDNTANLVGLYSLNDNANDSSGKNNNGTAKNLTYGAGKFGNAGIFNGSNSYVNLPVSSSFALGDEMTLVAWVKVYPMPAGTIASIIKRGAFSTGSNNQEYQLRLNEGAIEVILGDGTSYISVKPSNTAMGGPVKIDDGQWHFVAAVISADGMVNVYRDTGLYWQGRRTNKWAGTSIAQYIGTAKADTGKTASQYLYGSIDEVRFYNKALPAADIQALYSKNATAMQETTNNGFLSKITDWFSTSLLGNLLNIFR